MQNLYNINYENTKKKTIKKMQLYINKLGFTLFLRLFIILFRKFSKTITMFNRPLKINLVNALTH